MSLISLSVVNVGIIVALISFTLFGIEEIGEKLEIPFGYDANDLPLDEICTTVERDIGGFITWNHSQQSNSKFSNFKNVG